MAFVVHSSSLGGLGWLGCLAHFGHALGLNDERAKLGEAFTLIAFLRAQVVGLDEQFPGVGEVVRAERGEAVPGGG